MLNVLCACCDDEALQFVFHVKPIAFCPSHAARIFAEYATSESHALPVSLYSSVMTREDHEMHLKKPLMCVQLLQTWEKYLRLGFSTNRNSLCSRIKDTYKETAVNIQSNSAEFISAKQSEIRTTQQLVERLDSFYQGVSELLKQIKDSFNSCFQGAVSVYTQRLLDWSPDVHSSVPMMLMSPSGQMLDLNSLFRDYTPQTYVDEVYTQLWFVVMIERHFADKKRLKALSKHPNMLKYQYAASLAILCKQFKLQLVFLDASDMMFTIQDYYEPYLPRYAGDGRASNTLNMSIKLFNDAYQIGVPKHKMSFAYILKTFPEPFMINGASESLFKSIKGMAILWESGRKSEKQAPLLPEDNRAVDALLSDNLSGLYLPYVDLKSADFSLENTEAQFRQGALLFLKGNLLKQNGYLEEGIAASEQAMKYVDEFIAKCRRAGVPTKLTKPQSEKLIKVKTDSREVLHLGRQTNIRNLEMIAFWLDYSCVTKAHRENSEQIAPTTYTIMRSNEEFQVTELFHRGEEEEAERVCSELIQSHHSNPDIPIRCYLILGLINRHQSRFYGAESWFFRAIELAKEKIPEYQKSILYNNAVFLTGCLYVEMERYQVAESHLKQVAEGFDRIPNKLKFTTKMKYATLLRKTFRFYEAEMTFQDVISDLNAGQSYETALLLQEARQGLALSICDNERAQESLSHCLNNTTLWSFDLYLKAGNERRFRGEYQAAENIYRRIMELDKPKSNLECAKLRLEWATLCLLQSRFGAVDEHCDCASSLFPNDLSFHSERVVLHAILACSFYVQRDITKCEENFQAAFQICLVISDPSALKIACTALRAQCDVAACVSKATSVCKDVFAARCTEVIGSEMELLQQRQKSICEFLLEADS